MSQQDTYFHVVAFTQNLSGRPARVAARLHHVMADHLRGALAEHVELQADTECRVILRIVTAEKNEAGDVLF